MDRNLLEYNPELHAFEANELEAGESGWFAETGAEEVFGEIEEMELAAALLEVTDEAELDHFLGRLIGQAGQAVGRFVSTPTGQALSGILKGAMKQALPMAGRAPGRYIGADRVARIGGRLASAAGRIFGLELEGMSPEDKEFEAAKSFVRFAGVAVRNVLSTPIAAAPQAVAKKAVVQAARRHAPGLLRSRPSAPRHTGRWYRRGRSIIVKL
ncbi:hypothetical protein [Nitrosospira sp. Nsp1]|uniref:hypothetical protein n=1 Tax=Nitrosospira sp. Nsp1 TaxID=136547 RepID=UPI0008800AB0|nr:hypothetical protein [Nitrosospira sp. Nsp1]SCX40940.1 hypothetical protein SAMN05720354_103181 [Nitrosospira sp. Nsp1]